MSRRRFYPHQYEPAPTLGRLFGFDEWQRDWHELGERFSAVDRLAQERAQLMANRLEGDTHQAWALQDDRMRERLVVVHQLDGSCPPAVASILPCAAIFEVVS